MEQKSYTTPLGVIKYWVNIVDRNAPTLVFLPGLTVDHRLFEKQIEYFEGMYNVFVWDAPGHAESWPFKFEFSLMDKATWLYEILQVEQITTPILIGQSMGGYVCQCFVEKYPNAPKGMIIIDSAPLQRKFTTSIEIWLLKRMEPMLNMFPWKLLVASMANQVAVSEYGKNLMRETMKTYSHNKHWYTHLAAHGYKILAEAMEMDLPYKITCPALIICGKQDKAGSCIRYCKAWHKDSGIPIEWIDNAGHNSNTDQPEIINALIEEFARRH